MVRSMVEAAASGRKNPAIKEETGAPGMRTNVVILQLIKAAILITKVTANPIPKAISTFLDTPTKGQIPTK